MRTPPDGLDEAPRTANAEALNALLAEVYVLLVKTRKAQWDLPEPHRLPARALWDAQRDALEDTVDEVAACVRARGEAPVATMTGLVGTVALREAVGRVLNDALSVDELRRDHERVARALRALAAAGDGPGDRAEGARLGALARRHEEHARALRAPAVEAPRAAVA